MAQAEIPCKVEDNEEICVETEIKRASFLRAKNLLFIAEKDEVLLAQILHHLLWRRMMVVIRYNELEEYDSTFYSFFKWPGLFIR